MKMNKQGSALLIVLGFLSFMVVSAVAFAIYMRAERKPSSAVRRTVATRQLVKAALAEAISRVDDAVRNDPFPGLVATNANLSYHFSDDSNQAVDVWMGRVFMPPNPQGGTTDGETRTAPISETVSVLNLEALGYLPPPLVNDVRFLSRSSWAASWQQLPFDVGRFAYCAVNVSDYLDINRIPASKPRTSEPQRRLSLAHLFDPEFDPADVTVEKSSDLENKKDAPNINAAKNFDDKTGKGEGNLGKGYLTDSSGGDLNLSDVGSFVPYVSMLDYNLALKQMDVEAVFSSFYCDWLLCDRDLSGAYYEEDDDARNAARQPFVTDSWSMDEKTWTVDLATLNGQPFSGAKDLLSRDAVTYDDIYDGFDKSQLIPLLKNAGAFGAADYATLCDYLDWDDVPVSLALPCVESVPMIAGLTPPQHLAEPTYKEGDKQTTEVDGATVTTTTFNVVPEIWLKNIGWMKVLVPFPFKRIVERYGSAPSYKVQVLMQIVWTKKGLVKKEGEVDVVDESLLQQLTVDTTQIWERNEIGWKYTPGPKSQLQFTGLSKQKEIRVRDVLDMEDAYVEGDGVSEGVVTFEHEDFNGLLPAEIPVLQKIETKGGTASDEETQIKGDVKYKIKINPFGSEVDGEKTFKKEELPKDPFVPYVFIWARILNSEGKTVDLVPALTADDKLNGRSSKPGKFMGLDTLTGGVFLNRDAAPVEQRSGFAFAGDENENAAFSFVNIEDRVNKNSPGVDAVWSTKGVYAVDPRFNAAPAHWYPTKDEVTFDKWLTNTKNELKNFTDRDPDIFMFCSDQGVLQSLNEFSFLPYLHDPGDNETFTDSFGSVSGKGLNQSVKQVMDDYPYIWRTYSIDEVRDINNLAAEQGIGRSRQNEQLVNPHTDNLGVMLAALAYTPYDYWATAAGVDENNELFKELGNHDFEVIKAPFDNDYRKKYTFNAQNNHGALLKYPELVQIAKTIMGAMGGINLPSDDEAFKAIEKVGGNVIGTVDGKDLRGSIAKKLKEQIRGGVLPSNAWQLIWDELWDVLAFGQLDPNDEDSFRRLLWTNDATSLLLEEPLHYVDRKFLYSYWRDCFANNQQLFLIFVRAESSALGGPGEGTPGQQGGRAVALVWRDPDWTGTEGKERDDQVENNGDKDLSRPHRTRVLFYHQFD